jgi:DNA invertase Pin-like site-specific DNA recombinase
MPSQFKAQDSRYLVNDTGESISGGGVSMKFAIYCRVSTREQHPENQRIELEEYAKRMRYEYEIFEETESTRNTRPIKQDLLQRLRKKEFDGVLVWKLDRWARSLSEMVLEVKELIDKGIAFVSLKDNIDLSNAAGRLTFHIFSAFAEFEREIIKERTLLGLERAKKEGKKLGRPTGSKDKKERRKSGYLLRYAGKEAKV